MSNKSGAERIYRGSCPFLFKNCYNERGANSIKYHECTRLFNGK